MAKKKKKKREPVQYKADAQVSFEAEVYLEAQNRVQACKMVKKIIEDFVNSGGLTKYFRMHHKDVQVMTAGIQSTVEDVEKDE